MHCMGYTEAMRRRVAAVTGKPVLLARRLVASAVAELTA
jgi:protein AroM